MRNLSTGWGPGDGKRGSNAGLSGSVNQQHAKYKVCLSVWELGGTVLLINCLTNTEKLLEHLKETGASHLVCDSFNIEQGLNLRQQLENLKQVILIGESEDHDVVVTVKSLMETETNTRVGGGKFDWDKTPICLMLTTRNGESKIVKHTNKSLTAQVFSPKGASNNWFDQNVGDSLFCAAWFFHFPGLVCWALCALQGVSMYFMSEYSDQQLLGALADTRVPNVVLYPWQVRMMSQSPGLDIFDMSQLRVIITGGSILGPTISRDLLEKLPTIRFIRESYGMKEAGLLTYNYPKYDKSGSNTVPDDHVMPVGLPNMWTSFKIIDRVTESPVSGPDLQGEICIKTCQMSPGYLDTNDDLLDSEGYFHTGDMGYYDKDGIIHFVEQISNLISFWMYEISPSVLESRLLSHSSVADAAVVSVPDKENGHLPRAFVVLKGGHEETEENLINFLESRLQDHERLRGGLYYIQNIPRDENWKVLKSVLQKFIPPLKGDTEAVVESTDSLQVQEKDKTDSPRTQRAISLASQLVVPAPPDRQFQHKEAEEIFGMKSRSRRGSKEDIIDSNTDTESGAQDTQREIEGEINHITKEEMEDLNATDSKESEINYFLHVSIYPSFIEKKISTHPGVEEALVRGVPVEGVGQVPRAYVVLKQGFSIPGEELAAWINSRLEWRHRLRGGVVLVDRLPRDSQGKLMVNLDKFDTEAVAVTYFEEGERFPTLTVTSI